MSKLLYNVLKISGGQIPPWWRACLMSWSLCNLMVSNWGCSYLWICLIIVM